MSIHHTVGLDVVSDYGKSQGYDSITAHSEMLAKAWKKAHAKLIQTSFDVTAPVVRSASALPKQIV